jgi:hypothetical protein
MDFFKVAMTAVLFVSAPTWAGDLTGPQNNAVRSAKQYLSMQGFSRNGLIRQLSSEAGDGYTVEPPRIWWRLQLLRKWSHEQVEQIFY